MVVITMAGMEPPLVSSAPEVVCSAKGPTRTRAYGASGRDTREDRWNGHESTINNPPLQGVRMCTNHGARWSSEQGGFILI